MNANYFFISFLLIFAFSFQSKAQNFLTTQGQAIVNEEGDTIILRGMGLGGWMVQEGYMLQTAEFATSQRLIKEHIQDLIGEEGTEDFYDAWLNNHCRKADIDSLKSWGFNSVRLPMHYNLFTLPIEDEPVAGENTWLEKGFVLTDSLISWCAQNEMYVILDLHAAPGGQGYDEAISDYDPSKPSLWESSLNRDKMASLWKRLAERYVDEEWVAGYDLLNEPNWNMDGNLPLRDLYFKVTDSIRTVDTKHILFIEGNWFANDFTNLTPPWDDKIVYAPHKYWSFNETSDIQWVLSMRDQYNVPLYFGESGENSNLWFRDAIHLIEGEGIGWAWWPMKKIESIAGPLSITKTNAYEALLNYWKGNGPAPSVTSATNTLMQLTEDLKVENCRYQKDVIDAMFRQVQTDETIPFAEHTIPGVVYASDYDMGRNGFAYYDNDVANYSVSSGNFTTWNTGWTYRNDGVDMEPSADNVNSNGYMVGWTEEGEWIDYHVTVEEEGVYEVNIRAATIGSTGRLHLSMNGSDISNLRYVPITGSFNNFQTMNIPSVVLTSEDNQLRFHSDGSGFNVGSFEFVKVGEIDDLETSFLSAATLDNQRIKLTLNKPMAELPENILADFTILSNGTAVPITAIEADENARSIILTADYTFLFNQIIKISYAGTEITSMDGVALETFLLKDVLNNLPDYFLVPGRIEAEDYIVESGIVLEETTDQGGGQNIGYLDIGDYLDYNILVSEAGVYNVTYRCATEQSGQIKMQLVAEDGSVTDIHDRSIPTTGGWQTWTNVSQSANLPEGPQTIRLLITGSPFNLNWFEFDFLTSVETIENQSKIVLYPNPNNGSFVLNVDFEGNKHLDVRIYNELGQTVLTESHQSISGLNKTYDISGFTEGKYFVVVYSNEGERIAVPFVKMSGE